MSADCAIGRTTEIRDLGRAMRETLRMTIHRIGLRNPTPPELHRVLQIDRKMAWKVSRFLMEENVFNALAHLPGRAGYSSFMRKLKKAGAASEDLSILKDYWEVFEELSAKNAPTRNSFDLMLQSLSNEGLLQSFKQKMRDQFNANSYLLGIQSRVHFSSWILHPTVDGKAVDTVSIRGIVDLYRNRPRAPFILQSLYHGDARGKQKTSVRTVPLEKDTSELAPCSFLREFCSQPLPELLSIERTDELWTVKLADGPIGMSSPVTLVSGELFKGMEPRWHTSDYPEWEYQSRVRTPCENFACDFIVHESLLAGDYPEATICQDFTDLKIMVPLSMRSPETVITMDEEIVPLGSGLQAAYFPLVPQYEGMLDRAAEVCGWNPGEMRVFRIVIKYPVTPSSVYIKLRIPER